MKISINQHDLILYITRQLNNNFPDRIINSEEISPYLTLTMERAEFCFSKVNNKYFRDENGKAVFSHLHADQYAMFLYFLSNSIYMNDGDTSICTKLFQLNRLLHGIDAFYEVNLPDIFLFVHPIGTVLGRGSYSNYFMVYQRCSIGSNKSLYPVLGEYVTLHPGASVLGNSVVGNNCRLGAGSLLLDRNLENDSLYIGCPSNFRIKNIDSKPDIWIKTS